MILSQPHPFHTQNQHFCEMDESTVVRVWGPNGQEQSYLGCYASQRVEAMHKSFQSLLTHRLPVDSAVSKIWAIIRRMVKDLDEAEAYDRIRIPRAVDGRYSITS